ncbi:MAG TPA: non-canonical purine NTP diphosphatase [Bacteroidales bacterium]|nr:non-canonical purine NTP diphosphatase [Bacteroidales bacterium]HOH22631.1 non-canonical purine NTP diphosphatase [Bacteroidales bacterium]HPZ03776.1 non-canonical purine NTP diphosphatase [Bacteroidales bacterium]HQB75332.1 non-canonical purine NTP diphosphatase [Bacteroidales bacterium]HQQ20348.1 non-canonical purine NTP diphosphatase [Bacteroidales bacterium]
MEIVFATQNKHKLEEIQKIVGDQYKIISLTELNFFEDIPETENTLVGNALMKARFIHKKFHCNCFADDTGLEIDALHGAPGVYSARYAGPACSFEDNMRKVLSQMEGISNRKAQFKTVIALILDNKEYLFEGSVSGTILEKKSGTQGFGYDPIFLPDGYNESFAEMSAELKNRISHRAVATQKLTQFLHSLAL